MSDVAGEAIRLTRVCKRYKAQRAVRDLSVSVPRGCVYALLGPNGAGKSTVIKMLMGLLRPNEGSIHVLGCDIADDPTWIKQRVGYVPELHFIYRWMRVAEAVGFCASFYPTWNDGLCGELLDRFELEGRKRVRHLSKGMVVKLALTLALSHEPEVLVLDEPTSGLDPLVREELLEGVLRTMCDGRRTILLASHTLTDVERLADRVGILYEGELLVDRPLDELLESTRTVRAVLRDGCLPQYTPPGTIYDRVDRREWSVTLADFSEEKLDELRSRNPITDAEVGRLNLEEIFKAYVRGRRVVA